MWSFALKEIVYVDQLIITYKCTNQVTGVTPSGAGNPVLLHVMTGDPRVG